MKEIDKIQISGKESKLKNFFEKYYYLKNYLKKMFIENYQKKNLLPLKRKNFSFKNSVNKCLLKSVNFLK